MHDARASDKDLSKFTRFSSTREPIKIVVGAAGIFERSELQKESAYGEYRYERPADCAVGFERAGTGVFGEASSSSPCCPGAV